MIRRTCVRCPHLKLTEMPMSNGIHAPSCTDRGGAVVPHYTSLVEEDGATVCEIVFHRVPYECKLQEGVEVTKSPEGTEYGDTMIVYLDGES